MIIVVGTAVQARAAMHMCAREGVERSVEPARDLGGCCEPCKRATATRLDSSFRLRVRPQRNVSQLGEAQRQAKVTVNLKPPRKV